MGDDRPRSGRCGWAWRVAGGGYTSRHPSRRGARPMSVIEIETLLGEIEATAPCGEDLEYDPELAELEAAAQETPERQYGDTIIPAQPPDWRAVKQTALSLFGRTRDLRVAVALARASLHVDGLPGFAAGLGVVEGLLERYWDGVYPLLDPEDDNDPTLRVNVLVALCDQEATLRGVREMPLVNSRALGRFSLRDVQIANGLLAPLASDEPAELPTQSKIDGAFLDADLDELQATAAAVAAAIERAKRIEVVLTELIGVARAPDMSALAGVLKEIHQVLAQQLQKRGVGLIAEATADGTAAGESPAGAVTGPRLVAGEIGNRDEAVRMLDRICDYFERHEPSSPVPFLLKRAKKLVTKDFMAILNDLAPGGAEQATLIFGLQGEEPGE
ncbi:MAG TPA: type VI secretion system protein TssA [Candidatus Competibacteraceae bacterium]|nr:type VI secretion system protein TssA [Candidatus Competibacteraceae bacterium]